MSEYKSEDTIVGIGMTLAVRMRNHLTTIKDLDETLVDMTTIVIVGNKETYVKNGRMITPRGSWAAEMAGVSTLRFERQATLDLSGAIVVHSTQEAIDDCQARPRQSIWERKTLPLFVKDRQSSGLSFRVLPTSEVLLACENVWDW